MIIANNIAYIFQLTTYEKQKKLRRKEQNRVAAQRCRKKKREQSKNVVQVLIYY